MPAAIERTVLISSSPVSSSSAERAACCARSAARTAICACGRNALPAARQPHRARQPLEQLAADLLLERPDLLRQRRLRHVHAQGGARERALLHDGEPVRDPPIAAIRRMRQFPIGIAYGATRAQRLARAAPGEEGFGSMRFAHLKDAERPLAVVEGDRVAPLSLDGHRDGRRADRRRAPMHGRARANAAAGGATASRSGPACSTRRCRAPSKIACVGLNYHDHCRETGMAAPERPLIFAKFTSSLTAPTPPSSGRTG